MISRIFVGILAAVLAFAMTDPCGAAPTAPSQTVKTAVVAYILQNHQGHVTVKSGTGKTLKTALSATPTLQLVISFLSSVAASPVTGGTSVGKSELHQVSLRLEDKNGLGLWSQLIPVAPETHSFSFTAKTSSAMKGTRLEFISSTKKSEDAAASDSSPPPAPVVITIGADGQFIGMKGLGKELVTTGSGSVMTSTDGSGESAGINLGKGGHETFVLNGVQTSVDQVTRDGKSYMSFPWNGHKVLIRDGCTFTINSDGDLTVDAPGVSK